MVDEVQVYLDQSQSMLDITAAVNGPSIVNSDLTNKSRSRSPICQ